MGRSRKRSEEGLASVVWSKRRAGAADEKCNTEFLQNICELIKAVLSGNTKAGVSVDACSALILYAHSRGRVLDSEDVDVILPGYDGDLRRADCVDNVAKALLNGADGSDGGGRGKPLNIQGNGACFFNAVALAVFGAKCKRPNEALGLSLAVRVAIVVSAIVHMEDFITGPEYADFYGTLQAYSAEEVDGAGELGCDTPEVLTESAARLMFLLAIKNIAGPFETSQQACIPWAAQAFGVKIRCFHPGASMKDVEGGSCFGGAWSKQLMGPLASPGDEPTIYLSMSVTSYKYAFSSIHEFTETTRRIELGPDGEPRDVRWMPEFRHWVLLLPAANASSLQVGEELAAAKRKMEAPARVFRLNVRRAVLAAAEATAKAEVEATAVKEEADRVSGAAVTAVDKMGSTGSAAAAMESAATLLFLLPAMTGSMAMSALLPPLAVLVMLWMPRLLGSAAAAKPSTAKKGRGAASAEETGAKEEGSRGSGTASVLWWAAESLGSTAVAMPSSGGQKGRAVAAGQVAAKEEEGSRGSRRASVLLWWAVKSSCLLPLAVLRLLWKPAAALGVRKAECLDSSGCSRPKSRRRKNVRRRMNVRRRKIMRRNRKMARRQRVWRRRKLQGRGKVRRRATPPGMSRRRRKRGVARRNLDEAVKASTARENPARRLTKARRGARLRRKQRLARRKSGERRTSARAAVAPKEHARGKGTPLRRVLRLAGVILCWVCSASAPRNAILPSVLAWVLCTLRIPTAIPRKKPTVDMFPPSAWTWEATPLVSFAREGIRVVGRRDGTLLELDCTSSQLGVRFSSNDSGDGPESTCLTCGTKKPGLANMCPGCYDKGEDYPTKQCSVCNLMFGEGERPVALPGSQKANFLRYLVGNHPNAIKFRRIVGDRRDLVRCPLRDKDPLCRRSACVYKEMHKAISRKDVAKNQKRGDSSRGPGRLGYGLSGPCPLPGCKNRIEDVKPRQAGAHFESWELFFSRARSLPIWKTLGRFTVETAVCNSCYMDWYNHHGAYQQRPAERDFRGVESYKKAAEIEESRLGHLDVVIAAKRNKGDGSAQFFLRQKLRVRFRVRVLLEFLAEDIPVTLGDLGEVLKDMIVKADPTGQDLAVLPTENPAKEIGRWVDRDLDIIADSVPIGRISANVIQDGRKSPALLYPYYHNMAQMGRVVASMNEAVERETMKVQKLEKEVAFLKHSNSLKDSDERDEVCRAALILRKAIERYAEESEEVVFDQANGQAPLTFADPVVEWKSNVPPLLVAFLNELACQSNEDAADEDVGKAQAARKCLVAGVLTSFAFNTWYKNANVMGLFLKAQGMKRDGLNFLANNFKITQTDRHLWGLRARLADILGTEREMKKLVPLTAALVACSFDNINLDVLRHFGKGGHVDLIGAIAYYAVLTSRGKVDELPFVPPRLDFARDFGAEHGRTYEIWSRFRLQVLACARRNVVKADGDFEVRLAKAIIEAASGERMVGVKDRRVPSDVKATYLGVVKLGTKTLADIIEYLDGLKQVLHVGVENGRRRAVIVGDQETFALLHKAKYLYENKFSWAIPWIGDWHLLEHTLDVIFRKWGGFGIIPLAKASDCYNAKLEKKNYHTRHAVFVSLLEALWTACLGEVEGASHAPGMPDEEVLGKLLDHTVDRGKHKTFGQWVELLLADGMAYLAVYIGIRTGDFDLREAALRRIAPLFLGYNKNKYHDLCIKHIADIAKLSPAVRSFMSKTFSLSLSGHPGKNCGLDEIQEMTMNKEFKGAATGTNVRYLQRLGLTLQHFSRSVQGFKEAFGSSVIYNRKIYASAHRTRSVKKMYESLTAAGSPFRLEDEKGKGDIISADGRVALKVLEESMLKAPETLAHMWENGVKEKFKILDPDRSQRDKSRKQIRLPVFSSAPEGRTTVTRAASKKERHIKELKKTIGVLSKSGTGGTPMVSGIPPQMGDSKGVMQGFSKSKAIDIVSKFAESAISKKMPGETTVPHTSVIDMATIVHQVSPQACGATSRSRNRLRTWDEYARHVVDRLVWKVCSREGKIEGFVVLCCDKRRLVANPKSFAHNARGLFPGVKSKSKKRSGPLFTRVPWRFGLSDGTPLAGEWQDFLKDRQHRDGVFSVLCQYIRRQWESIREKEAKGIQVEWFEHCFKKIRVRVDGEPVLSPDHSTTLAYKSWHMEDGVEIRDEENGLGEGELQALHHAYLVLGRQPTLPGEGGDGSSEGGREGASGREPTRVEVVSVDTDVWVAALLAYAVYPWTRNVRVVVRKQIGVNDQAAVTCIDVLGLFEALTGLASWPRSFTPLQRCLPVIAAYMLCGTDFTPTFYGLTSFFMFQSYFESVKNPENHRFVKALGVTEFREDGEAAGVALDNEELVKFVALAYYVKNKALFLHLPGHQIEPIVAPAKRNGAVDETKAWVTAIHERTSEKWYGEGELRSAAPNYDVIDLCVLRMSWVVEYWLTVVPVGIAGSGESLSYPILVPDWNDKGYLRNAEVEGGCMMLLRREPKVTIWPGGTETIKCKCSSVPGKGQCVGCVCITKGNGKCSELCKCKLACCKERATVGDVLVNEDGGQSTDGESDVEIDDEGYLPGFGGSDMGVSIGGFSGEDVLEYESIEQNGWADTRRQWVLPPSQYALSALGPGINERSI